MENLKSRSAALHRPNAMMSAASTINDLVLKSAFGSLLAGVILALTIVDLRRMVLPDRLTLLLAALGLGQSFVLAKPDLFDAGLGALIGGGTLALIAIVFRHIRGIEGLGLGDQKFVTAAGIWVGWQGIPLMLSLASVSALVVIIIRAIKRNKLDRADRLPFGPFLGAGTLLAWLVMVTS